MLDNVNLSNFGKQEYWEERYTKYLMKNINKKIIIIIIIIIN